MACSLLTIMKFGLDESRSLKIAVYLFGGLFTLITSTLKIKFKNEVGIQASETRDERWYLLQHSLVENPYFGIEHKIIAIPCQSRDFPLSYGSSLVSLLFIAWIPTSFLHL